MRSYLLHYQKKKRNILQATPLWSCLLLALGIRLWLTVHTNGVIDGDEAIVGIQALHIVHGERPFPLYFYGQAYMGSLEAYLVALLISIFGSSVEILRAETILLSLVIVWLTWNLATAIANSAHLSLTSTQIFRTIAAFLAALPPLYDTVLELRTLGGYIETFILMLFLLLSALRLTQRWHEGASIKETGIRWPGIGFLIGLGLWIDPLIISAILVSALWIGYACVLEIIQRIRQKITMPTDTGKTKTKSSPFLVLLLSLTSLPAALFGFFPALHPLPYYTRFHSPPRHWPTNIRI